MADFFTSPQEKAATNLYNLAMSGKTPYDALFDLERRYARQSVESKFAGAQERVAGDIMSQFASAGVPYSSGVVDVIGKARADIAEKEVSALSDAEMRALMQRIAALSDTLKLGLGGLSSSSTFGDILAGLTAVGKIGAGIATLGGSSGFGWWGAGSADSIGGKEIKGSQRFWSGWGYG